MSTQTEARESTRVTTIAGYQVELELFMEDGEERSDCVISKLGTPYAGSMGQLMGFGTLEDYDTGDYIDVPTAIQSKLIHWAEENGY